MYFSHKPFSNYPLNIASFLANQGHSGFAVLYSTKIAILKVIETQETEITQFNIVKTKKSL